MLVLVLVLVLVVVLVLWVALACAHLAASGNIWQHLAAPGSTWQHLVACGSIWDLLAASGTIQHMCGMCRPYSKLSFCGRVPTFLTPSPLSPPRVRLWCLFCNYFICTPIRVCEQIKKRNVDVTNLAWGRDTPRFSKSHEREPSLPKLLENASPVYR